MERPKNVLFLCTNNSARSIMAEAILDRWSNGRFKGYSGGSRPKGEVHPTALVLLKQFNLKQFNMRTEDLRSKSWDEFARPGAPAMDYIFTVCDQASGEMCPAWPGHPMTAHWGVPDPNAVIGSPSVQALAFREAFRILETRIRYFLTFQFKKLGQQELQRMVIEAGKLNSEPAS